MPPVEFTPSFEAPTLFHNLAAFPCKTQQKACADILAHTAHQGLGFRVYGLGAGLWVSGFLGAHADFEGLKARPWFFHSFGGWGRV